MLWTLAFWKGLAERAIKTFAQAVAGLLAGDTVGLLDVDWGEVLSVAGLITLASVLTSIGNAGFTAGEVTPPVVEDTQLSRITTVSEYQPLHRAEKIRPRDENPLE